MFITLGFHAHFLSHGIAFSLNSFLRLKSQYRNFQSSVFPSFVGWILICVNQDLALLQLWLRICPFCILFVRATL